MKSYIDECRLRADKLPSRLIDFAETPLRIGFPEPITYDFSSLERHVSKQIKILDEAHFPAEKQLLDVKFSATRGCVTFRRVESIEYALSGYFHKYPPIKDTHRTAYEAIRSSIKSDDLYFDTLTTFVRTGRFQSKVPNESAKPSSAVYIGARSNGKTYAQQAIRLRTYQQSMIEAIRALHVKGWKL